ncbi:MAG: radical SAM protein [Myxococcales bacterium]|nr:radical SAM protein [Myxococcales bacterium]
MTLAELRKDAAFALGVARRRRFQVLVQVTNRCNMTCDFCDFWPNGVAPQQELTVADFARLADELAALGTMFISVEGGEPLVRKDIVEVLRVLSRQHLTCLYTNGWFVTPTLARQIFDAGVTQVGVSIDYADAAAHDRRRGVDGATARAWRALAHLREAAPAGGRALHVMTVLMDDNLPDLERLLEQSQAAGVGHWVTLVSVRGYRRGTGGVAPTAPLSARLLELRRRYDHLRVFRDYVTGIDAFTTGDTAALPRCRAGEQSFNIDHQGGVSPCIERIDWTAGSIRDTPLTTLLARMHDDPRVAGCQQCWTVCRGFAQALGDGGTVAGWVDLVSRMRSR